MTRFAIFRVGEGGWRVPVAISWSCDCDCGEGGRKNRQGMEPHVTGAMKDAIAVWPGWRKRTYLWTSFGVLPVWLKRGLMRKRRGPHWKRRSCFDFRAFG